MRTDSASRRSSNFNETALKRSSVEGSPAEFVERDRLAGRPVAPASRHSRALRRGRSELEEHPASSAAQPSRFRGYRRILGRQRRGAKQKNGGKGSVAHAHWMANRLAGEWWNHGDLSSNGCFSTIGVRDAGTSLAQFCGKRPPSRSDPYSRSERLGRLRSPGAPGCSTRRPRRPAERPRRPGTWTGRWATRKRARWRSRG